MRFKGKGFDSTGVPRGTQMLAVVGMGIMAEDLSVIRIGDDAGGM